MADQKRLIEIVAMPLVLALVGAGSTFFITRFQAKHTEEMSRAQRDGAAVIADAQIQSSERLAHRDQALKVLEIFAANITKNDPAARRLAVGVLPAVDPDLGRILASVIASTDSDPVVRNSAARIEGDAVQAEITSLIAAFSGPERLTASSRIAALYERADANVRQSIVRGLTNAVLPEQDPSSYRVNIYVALTLSRLTPKWLGTESQRTVISNLRNSGNYGDATFRLRVDQALANYAAAQ